MPLAQLPLATDEELELEDVELEDSIELIMDELEETRIELDELEEVVEVEVLFELPPQAVSPASRATNKLDTSNLFMVITPENKKRQGYVIAGLWHQFVNVWQLCVKQAIKWVVA